MRLAFQHFGGDAWLAGNTFIENILLALCALGPDSPTRALIVDQRTPEQDFRALAVRANEVLGVQMPALNPAPAIHWSLREHFTIWLRRRLLSRPQRIAPDPYVA